MSGPRERGPLPFKEGAISTVWTDRFWALQYIDTFPGERGQQDAERAMEVIREQEGFIAGRILAPSGLVDKNQWRIQCLFEDAPGVEMVGTRRVLVLPSMQPMFKVTCRGKIHTTRSG